MLNGVRVKPAEPVATIRDRCRTELACMPEDIRRMGKTSRSYSVSISPALDAFDREVRDEIAKAGLQKNA
jgi:hypothetical protein